MTTTKKNDAPTVNAPQTRPQPDAPVVSSEPTPQGSDAPPGCLCRTCPSSFVRSVNGIPPPVAPSVAPPTLAFVPQLIVPPRDHLAAFLRNIMSKMSPEDGAYLLRTCSLVPETWSLQPPSPTLDSMVRHHDTMMLHLVSSVSKIPDAKVPALLASLHAAQRSRPTLHRLSYSATRQTLVRATSLPPSRIDCAIQKRGGAK